MSQTANCLNISQPGMMAFDGVATFFGRTLQGGAGITITNGTGIGGNPIISLTGGGVSVEHLTGDSGGALNPDGSNNFNLLGAVVDNGTNAKAVFVTGSGSTVTTDVQVGVAIGSADVTKVGLAAFSSNNFNVTASTGFVTLSAGVTVSSFLAFLNTTVNNVTGDGTNYPLVLNSTLFNVGSNFNTGTGKYTAPVTGTYHFSAAIPAINIGAGHTKGRWYIVVENASAVTQTSYEFCQVSPAAVANSDTNCLFAGSATVSMNATDRAYISLQIYNSTKTIGIQGSGSLASSPYASLSGYLIC